MFLSAFIAALQNILATRGDTVLALECVSQDGGLLLLEVTSVDVNSDSPYLHIVVNGDE